MKKLNNFKLRIKGKRDLQRFKDYIKTGDRIRYYPTYAESFLPMIGAIAIGQVANEITLNQMKRIFKQ